MKHIILLLAIFLHSSTFAQSTENKFVLTNDSDTSFYSSHKKRMKVFSVPDIRYQNVDFIFRSWNPVGVLTVQRIGKEITAEVLYQVFKGGDTKRKKAFSKTYKLPSQQAKLLYNAILKDQASQLPSDKFIKNWSQGLDGIIFTFETKIKENYSIKHYWTPSSQKNLEQAKQIISFEEKLGQIGELSQYAELFKDENPFSAYTYYGVSYEIHTLKSKRKSKKKVPN